MVWNPTPEQQAVLDHDPHQPARLLAGPGTGKSATIIRMMLRAAEQLGRKGKLLTFTRAATNELRDKVAEHPEHLDRPSTIHSFAISTLLANEGVSGLPRPIRIADDWESRRLIREHLKVLVDCHVRLIDRAITEMASNWQSLEPDEDPNLPEDVRNRFAGVWEHHRRLFGYSLLDELPYRLLRALEDHPDLTLGEWDYLVVDEYQDLNQCDLSVLKQIAVRGRGLVASGDDDQSIYSFRRAHPVGIRRFVTDDYPGAADLTLSVSQRCATTALTWARHVIEGLPGRPTRAPLTPAPHCQPGEARYLRFNTWTAESAGVARLVKWLIDCQGVAPADIAVMFRSDVNRAWSGPLMNRMSAMEVPTVDADEVSKMVSETANRRLLALARLIVDRNDSLAWWTLLTLQEGLGEKVRDHFYGRAEASAVTFAAQLLTDHGNDYPGLATAQANRVRSLVGAALDLIDVTDLDGADLGQAGWGTWLVGHADQFGGCEPEFAELLVELDDLIDPAEGLGRFLGQVSPVGTDLRSGRTAGAVRLMTMARSKGLTVRAAIVVGVEDGVVPLANRDPGEERRLLYVAMTRATEYLFLTWARSRTGPTARTGAPRVGAGRNRSPLLTHGPVQSQDGASYLTSLE